MHSAQLHAFFFHLLYNGNAAPNLLQTSSKGEKQDRIDLTTIHLSYILFSDCNRRGIYHIYYHLYVCTLN